MCRGGVVWPRQVVPGTVPALCACGRHLGRPAAAAGTATAADIVGGCSSPQHVDMSCRFLTVPPPCCCHGPSAATPVRFTGLQGLGTRKLARQHGPRKATCLLRLTGAARARQQASRDGRAACGRNQRVPQHQAFAPSSVQRTQQPAAEYQPLSLACAARRICMLQAISSGRRSRGARARSEWRARLPATRRGANAGAAAPPAGTRTGAAGCTISQRMSLRCAVPVPACLHA